MLTCFNPGSGSRYHDKSIARSRPADEPERALTIQTRFLSDGMAYVVRYGKQI